MAGTTAVTLPPRQSFSRITDIRPMPNLIQVQLDSFEWFKREGLRELFAEISPIEDFTNKNLRLDFIVPEDPFGKPKYEEEECRDRDATYAAPLTVKARLTNKETGQIVEKDIFMGDFPLMTREGTFIINGAERVVVSQLVRSPGAYFTLDDDTPGSPKLFGTKLIPNRGAWLEFETSAKHIISVKIDRKRKIPITTLLRAMAEAGEKDPGRTDDTPDLRTDEAIIATFADVDTGPYSFIGTTLDKDPIKNPEDAMIEVYKKLRPGDPATKENARNLVVQMFYHPRRYDLGNVGRYKLNRKLGLAIPQTTRTLTQNDMIAIVKRLVQLDNGIGRQDDIDHLGNRRVRSVGELIQQQFRVGLVRMERVVRERISVVQDPTQVSPNQLINIRPVVAAMKEFFGGSQLSQFMDQTNPLAEIGHKRRLSALGPGGLSRERAGFEVRDVHSSHYGRICPIETPEGPNIGLIGNMATHSTINRFGFIETPYRRVYHTLHSDDLRLLGRHVRKDVMDGKNVAVPAGTVIDQPVLDTLLKLKPRDVTIQPWVSLEVEYLTADEEEKFTIAQANAAIDTSGHFISERATGRHEGEFVETNIDRLDYMDISPSQMVSVAASLIPFLEHDDVNRALMGANMQRQAVPLLRPQSPIVGTGVEKQVAVDSGHVIVARANGEVVS
nr:DNA-directed RNA polymerase subunit beta [Ktedonobacterales bacterium]